MTDAMDLPLTDVAGGCHCGAIRFQARLVDGLRTARRCNCSLCRMRGAIAVSVALPDLVLTKGADRISEYRFNTGAARHFFCPVCGIYTHHQRRSNPGQYGLNVACIDGISPFDFAQIQVLDGVNHPADAAGTGRDGIVGTLRFERAKPQED
jgi:hypothetical protein